MDRKLVKRLQRSFEKRGGTFGVAPGAPPESIVAMLDQLLGCPDCRAAVLEACNGDARDGSDIDDLIRGLTLSRHH